MENQRQDKQYREAVVSFIDILGFKDMITNRTANEVYNIYQLFHFQSHKKSQSDFEERSGLSLEYEVYSFSDSVVRIKYVNDNDIAFLVENDEILSLGTIQNELFKKGVMIRGGVVRGLIYSEPTSNTLYGPALNEAYRLENELAKTPRIILSNQVVQNYMRDMFSPAHWIKQNGLGNREEIKCLPNTEPFFINYFWGSFVSLYQLLAIKRDTGLEIGNGMEEYVTNFLSLYHDLKNKAENNIYNESTKLKFKWCKDNMHETIKDICEWIEVGFHDFHIVSHDTHKILKEQSEIYLNKK